MKKLFPLFALLVLLALPAPVKAAENPLPPSVDVNSYLAQHYPTFADFQTFASAYGTGSINYLFQTQRNILYLWVLDESGNVVARVLYYNFSSDDTLSGFNPSASSGTFFAGNQAMTGYSTYTDFYDTYIFDYGSGVNVESKIDAFSDRFGVLFAVLLCLVPVIFIIQFEKERF